MENKLYAVSVWCDYAGGGIGAVFSTLEKAKEYYNQTDADTVKLVIIEVDKPEIEEVVSVKYSS